MVNAKSLLSYELFMAPGAIAHFVVWELPEPSRGSAHLFKYRLALVVDGICVLRYDNEAGKGDHKHVGSKEFSYEFIDLDRLSGDFLLDARRWLRENARDRDPNA